MLIKLIIRLLFCLFRRNP